MPAPSNTTAGTALDLGALPASTTQNVFDAGTTYDVWYKVTAPGSCKLIGLWGYGDALAPYSPRTRVYTDAGITLLIDTGTSGANKPIQFPVTAGNTYWIRFTPNAGNPNPANLNIFAEVGPTDAVANGDILVNDDTDLLPLIVIDPTTGEVKNSFNSIPAGEAADILPDGIMLIADAWNSRLQLFDRDFNLITTVAKSVGFGLPIRANNSNNLFYFTVRTTGPTAVTLWTLDNAGNLGLGTIVLTGTTSQINGIASNLAGTVLYYTRNENSAPIRRWDISGNMAMADLVAAVANYTVSDILVLDDDSLVVMYVNTGTSDAFARRYDSAGATLNTYNFGTIRLPSGTLPRLAYDTNTGANFWAWIHLTGGDAGKSQFQKIRVSDGTVLTTTTLIEYETGVYNQAATLTPGARFGNSFSCPFMIMRGFSSNGTIIVQKVTNPSPDADGTTFNIVENITPGSFTLKNGENQVFNNVTPNPGYSVVEDADDNYITSYEVSNDPDNDNTNIHVSAGETVTVIITNTRKGSIIVGKMTDPYDNGDNTFNFTADAPLDPTTFSLASDGEQLFEGLIPGTYALRETIPSNFFPTYLFSNDSTTPEAISVSAGENVTVAVLNQLQSTGSGLYKLVPGRKNDRVINQDRQLVNRKIPEPFFITHYLQDL